MLRTGRPGTLPFDRADESGGGDIGGAVEEELPVDRIGADDEFKQVLPAFSGSSTESGRYIGPPFAQSGSLVVTMRSRPFSRIAQPHTAAEIEPDASRRAGGDANPEPGGGPGPASARNAMRSSP